MRAGFAPSDSLAGNEAVFLLAAAPTCCQELLVADRELASDFCLIAPIFRPVTDSQATSSQSTFSWFVYVFLRKAQKPSCPRSAPTPARLACAAWPSHLLFTAAAVCAPACRRTSSGPESATALSRTCGSLRSCTPAPAERPPCRSASRGRWRTSRPVRSGAAQGASVSSAAFCRLLFFRGSCC